MADLSREDILKRIAAEEARMASAYRNIEGLTTQAGKCQDEITRYYALLDALPAEEPTV
ncbi:MAG: hypothetical protein ABFD04_11720 [Syntrophomonas sp.]